MKKKQLNNFSIAHTIKDNPRQKAWRKQRKKRGFDDTEVGIYITQCINL